MILVITRAHDVHGAHMVQRLRERGEKIAVLDYANFPTAMEIGFSIGQSAPEARFTLPDGMRIDAKEVTSVLYQRRAEPQARPDIRSENIRRYIARESDQFLDSLVHMVSGLWVNNPDALRIANRKPHQLIVAAQLGFSIPQTTVGNDPALMHAFLESLQGDIAIKTLHSPGITIEERGEKKGVALYTKRLSCVDAATSIAAVKNCPVIFQGYIEKAFELRVTVVHETVFACAIHSQQSERAKDDWRRYDLANTPHEPYALPREIAERCVQLLKKLNLVFGCIDLIVTPDGEYVFLEINPGGQWLWVEQLTGLPISEAIADLLVNPPPTK